MKEIFEKLNEIKDEILLEKGANELRLFVLVARTDIDARWDILFSADWLEKTNSEKDLVYLIEKLKSKFDGNLDFLARIVVATPHEIFIKRLAKAIIRENGRRLLILQSNVFLLCILIFLMKKSVLRELLMDHLQYRKFQIFRGYHSIGFTLCFLRYSFALLKCLHPKKPVYAENGEG